MDRQTITVDIAPGNSQVERLGSSQGDIGRPMGVYIIQNGVALDCSAYSAELYIIKPDGKFYTTQATVDSTVTNLIKWETALQETPVAGSCAAQIRIAAGDDDIGTARFVEFVEASPGDMGSASESEVALLTEYVRQARESAESAGRDATTASGAASSASGSASTATTAANTATQAATAATAAADRAEAVEESIPADYTQLSDDVTGLKSAIVTKAEEDGYYEELTAGSAEQLISTEAVTDTTPYLYRKSGGSVDIGNRETLEKIVGGTVAWNQLVPTTAQSKTAEGVTFTNNGDGSWTVNGTASSNSAALILVTAPKSINDHVVYLRGCPADGGNGKYRLYINGLSLGVDTGNGAISKPTGLAYPHVQMHVYNGYTVENQVWKPQLFDLTAMFGPTIADYIYNLEQTTAGAGVAWFRKLFPKDYYPYNSGELISVKPSSHDMVGFNAWDEEWEVGDISSQTGENATESNMIRSKNYIHVFPGANYYIESEPNMRLRYYDANKQYIGATPSWNSTKTITIPSNCHYIRFATHYGYGNVYKNNICINLSHSGSRNGEYEPFEKHSYPLADVELRGPLAIDADGKLVYSGDEYTPDGQVKRKYGLVDLGTLNPYKYADGVFAYHILVPTTGSVLCNRYETAWNHPAPMALPDKNIATTNAIGSYYPVVVRDNSYTDAAAFKTAMSGVMLLYELATPTTETVAPYTPVQVVDDWGTEEFVDNREVAIPVGHSTSYMANLRDKLQHLPSLADEDGEYIIKQTGTKMELAKLSSSGLAQGIFVETESAPVVSFSDGADGQAMKAVNVAIEPVQDLHGYDHPWPGGGGKNKLNASPDIIKPLNTSGSWSGNTYTINGCTFTIADDGSVTVNGTFNNTTYFYLGDYATGSNAVKLNGLQGSYVNTLTLVGIGGSTWYTVRDTSGVEIPAETTASIRIYCATGASASNVVFKPMIRLASETDATYAPYSNICPITGWDGVKVTRTGKNLYSGTDIEVAGDIYYANALIMMKEAFKKLKPGQTYICSAVFYARTGSVADITFVFSDGQPSFSILRAQKRLSTDRQSTTFTIPANVNFDNLRYVLVYGGAPDNQTTAYVKDIQIEPGSTATDFELYSGNTYSITLPTEAGTVYGGELTVNADGSGSLVVDMASVDIGAFDWTTFSSADRHIFRAPYPNPGPYIASGSSLPHALCSSYYPIAYNPISASDNGAFSFGAGRFVVIDHRFTDVALFGASVSGVQLVYELATPITYNLTALEVLETLKGVNNIWSDANGDTSVTYRADTKLYIDNKITQAIAAALNA